MEKFVKIKIKNNKGQYLLHYYRRANAWSFPAGMVKEAETLKEAAIREFLERTGYLIDEKNLQETTMEEENGEKFHVFIGSAKDITKVQPPQTEIKWAIK